MNCDQDLHDFYSLHHVKFILHFHEFTICVVYRINCWKFSCKMIWLSSTASSVIDRYEDAPADTLFVFVIVQDRCDFAPRHPTLCTMFFNSACNHVVAQLHSYAHFIKQKYSIVIQTALVVQCHANMEARNIFQVEVVTCSQMAASLLEPSLDVLF